MEKDNPNVVVLIIVSLALQYQHIPFQSQDLNSLYSPEQY